MGGKKSEIRGERRSDGTTGACAHDAGRAIRAVQCRDLWGMGTGSRARRFHKLALAHVNNAFDIEYFHWSNPRFTAFWWQTFSVCTAREQDWSGGSQGRLSAAHPVAARILTIWS